MSLPLKVYGNCFIFVTAKPPHLLKQKCLCNSFAERRDRALLTFIPRTAQIHYHSPMATVPFYVFAAVFSLCTDVILKITVQLRNDCVVRGTLITIT